MNNRLHYPPVLPPWISKWMIKAFWVFIPLALFCRQSLAQIKPNIAGKMNVSVKNGLIRCDFKISGLPSLGKSYKILLNRGFNIKFFKDDTGKVVDYDGFYNSTLKGEAQGYILATGNDTLPLPQRFGISYTGAFPVYKDTLNTFDFKGFIAFNGKTVRAAEQTKWYPVIYDVKNERELLDVTYDISVECQDCKTIYINGSAPKEGPVARLKSENVSRQLLLFAGNYDALSLTHTTFLNASLNSDEVRVFDDNISSIINYYQDYLQIPYVDKITLLQHEAVKFYNARSSWGFVTYPTIAVAGAPFSTKVNIQSGLFKDTSTYYFYSHELAHYYFGHILQPNSTLSWFFLESMAEYLSIKATEAKYGITATTNYISRRKVKLKDVKIIPLSSVTDPNQITEIYRYQYAPLLLLAMEKRFGKEKVRNFCQLALHHSDVSTDYKFLLTIIKEIGIPSGDWNKFEQQVINKINCKAIFDEL